MKPQPNPNTMDDYQVSRNYPLFEHMADQLRQIDRIVLEMHGINPEKCTMNPQSNPQSNPHTMKEKTAMQEMLQWVRETRKMNNEPAI